MGQSSIDLSSVTTVGVDLAKHVFQVHAVDGSGAVLVAKAFKRSKVLAFFSALPPCLVGMEACGSAHFWARELGKLGHQVRLMPPSYVKPYVRRQKNDAADAAAICEAVTRPNMRFVAVRSVENQSVLMHHKTRELLVAQRTQILNALRGHLAEIGIIAAQGAGKARELAELLTSVDDGSPIPLSVRVALSPLAEQLYRLDEAIAHCDREIKRLAMENPVAKLLMSIPGFGPVTASAMVASVPDLSSFANPREFSAFLGLVPLQRSSGGKERLGRITKMGNRYLRKLLVVGSLAVLRHRKGHNDPLRNWADKLLANKPFKLVAVALANKLARIAFAIMRSGANYGGTGQAAATV